MLSPFRGDYWPYSHCSSEVYVYKRGSNVSLTTLYPHVYATHIRTWPERGVLAGYLPIGDPLFGTKPLSTAVFEILASKCIGITTTMTFQSHVTSPVT